MEQLQDYNPQKPRKRFQRVGSRIYFGRDTERQLFFILTAVMLICGILAKMGWI
jgi:hypothetical protein